MADITVTPASVGVLPQGSIIRSFPAGGSGNVGDAVALNSSGQAVLADADALATAHAIGIVVAVNKANGIYSTAFVSGDRVEVVTYGPVFLGNDASLTAGSSALVYVSTTAGSLDQTAPAGLGDFPFSIGWAESDSILFVSPQTALAVENV